MFLSNRQFQTECNINSNIKNFNEVVILIRGTVIVMVRLITL